jgi:hypothetical protein
MISNEEMSRMLSVFAIKQERIDETQKELIKCLEGVVELTGELEIVLKGFISFYYEKKGYTYDEVTSE